MEEKIDKAIATVLDQVRTNLKPDESLKATQAVLNMMHARALWVNPENRPEGKRPKTN